MDKVYEAAEALSIFYGIAFRYNKEKQRFEGCGMNGRIVMTVGTIGDLQKTALFGFAGPDELMPRSINEEEVLLRGSFLP
jgi:hypothetical protein